MRESGELNGAEVLVKSLEDLGVEYIFGYTGGAILPVFHALSNHVHLVQQDIPDQVKESV